MALLLEPVRIRPQGPARGLDTRSRPAYDQI